MFIVLRSLASNQKRILGQKMMNSSDVLKVELAEAHSKVFDAFSRAFTRQNSQFEKGKQPNQTMNPPAINCDN